MTSWCTIRPNALEESDKGTGQGWTTSSRFGIDNGTDQVLQHSQIDRNVVSDGNGQTVGALLNQQSPRSPHYHADNWHHQANMNFAQQAQSPGRQHSTLPQDHTQQQQQINQQQQQQRLQHQHQQLVHKKTQLKQQLSAKKQLQSHQQIGNSAGPTTTVAAHVKESPIKMYTMSPGTNLQPGKQQQQQRQNFQQQQQQHHQFHQQHNVQPNILQGKHINNPGALTQQCVGKSPQLGNLTKNLACDYVGSVKIPHGPSQAPETASQILMISRDQQQQQLQQQQYSSVTHTFDANGANISTQMHTQMPQTSNNIQISMSPQTFVSNIHSKSVGPGEGLTQPQIQQGTLPGVSAGQSLLGQTPTTSSNQHKGVLSKPNTVIKSDKVVLEGGGEFEEGQTYIIRDRQGNSRMMVWKGGQFYPSTADNVKSVQHSVVDSSQTPRGRGRGSRGRGRGQKGNATGANMASRGVSPGQTRFITPGQQQVYIRGRGRQANFHPGSPNMTVIRGGHPPQINIAVQSQSPVSRQGQMLQVRPALQNLMPAAQMTPKSTGNPNMARQPQTVEQQAEKEAAETTEGQTDDSRVDQNDAADLPNVPEDPNAVAVCQFCGYTSEDKLKCESCKRRFNKQTRYHIRTADDPQQKRRKLDNGAGMSDVGVNCANMDKKVFYGQKFDEQSQLYSKMFNSNNSASKTTTIVVTPHVRGKRGLSGRGRGRGRGRGVVVPETVTISSDEEDGAPKHRDQSLGQSTPLSKPGSTGSKSPGAPDQECPESPLIPLIPISSKIDKTGCRAKMEDELGIAVHTREKTPSPSEVILDAHTISVGTFRGVPIEPVLLSKTGLSFYIEGVSKAHRFCIYPQDIQQCLVMFDNSSTHFIFLLTSAPCGARVRKDLGIPHHTLPNTSPPDPYFDPAGIDMTHQMITLVLKKLEPEMQVEFQRHMELFKSMGKQGDEGFLMELNGSEAEEILKQSTQKISYVMAPALVSSPLVPDHLYSQHGEEEYQDDSLSPPRIGFAGPIIKLLTYPPPPEKGGHSITNEDLYCLQQGEFLNDVIIDFYLKYLYLEKFSEEDRARTHIFSSFFYKRLTQRIRGAAIDDDPCITLPVKRHARVKTWTRKLDLFSKDFIIIPINEHAHWFLAIVCFPGHEGPMENKFIPRPQAGPLIEPTNVPTPPQPTEDMMDEETEESQDNLTQSQVKMEQPESTVPSTLAELATTEASAGDVEKSSEEYQDSTADNNTGDGVEPSVDSDTKPTSEGEKTEPVTEDPVEKKTEAQAEETMDAVEAGNGKEETSDVKEKEKNGGEEDKTDGEKENVSQGTDTSGVDSEEKMDTTEPTETTTNEKMATKPAARNGGPVYCKPIRGQAVGADEEVTEDVMTGVRQPCIIIFDSLSGPSRSRIVTVLKEYLQVEWAVKRGGGELKKTLIKGCVPKVPQQNNYSDCGVFMLQYVESFFEDPIQDFTVPMKGLHDWFTIPKIEGKREEIRDLIIDLKEKYESKQENKDNT